MSKSFRRTLAATAVAATLVVVGALAPPRLREGATAASVGQNDLGPSQGIEAAAARAEELQDPDLFAELGSAYISRAAAAADPTLLDKAEEALQRSLGLGPEDNPAAAAGMAQLSNARHDFKASVRWAQKAIADNAYAAGPHGLLGDALFELGRVKAADASYQKMIDLRPDMASYIRVSYALGYGGASSRALEVLKMAEGSVAPVSEERAFILHQQGDVLYGMKRFAAAEEANRLGIEIAPGYAPPMVGAAESLIAQGRYEEALPLLEEATRILPSFSYLSAFADLLRFTDRPAEAEKASAAASLALAALRANGVLEDTDLILFDVGNGGDLDGALDNARAVYVDRPTAKTADVLAWVLFLDGKTGEAYRLARRSVRLYPKEAISHFHLAAIAEERGLIDSAVLHARRSLALDPAFSLRDLKEAHRLAELR